MELFDHLVNLTENKVEYDTSNDEMVKTYNSYIINRFVSMPECYTLLANTINQFSDIPKEIHYNYYLKTLPKRRIFWPYIKKAKEANKEDINLLCDYFEIGKREAQEYFEMLDEKQMKTLRDKYRSGVVK